MTSALQSTYSRGTIDSSNYWELIVHYMPEHKNPLCNNGSYHIRYTGNKKKVSCPICKKRLGIK